MAPEKRQIHRKKGRANRKKGRVGADLPIKNARARKNKNKQDEKRAAALSSLWITLRRRKKNRPPRGLTIARERAHAPWRYADTTQPAQQNSRDQEGMAPLPQRKRVQYFRHVTEYAMPTKTKPASSPPKPETPAKAPKKAVGRPPKGDKAQTGAERQAALRRRQQAAAEAQRAATLAAYARPEGKPTKDVLAALGMYLDNLADPAKEANHDLDRKSAWRAICELCAWCGIKPPPEPKEGKLRRISSRDKNSHAGPRAGT